MAISLASLLPLLTTARANVAAPVASPPRSATSPTAQLAAVRDLISRRLGERWTADFELALLPAGSTSVFELGQGSLAGKVAISGDSGVSLAVGLYE